MSSTKSQLIETSVLTEQWRTLQGVPKKKSALGNLMIVRTPDSWKHLRGPNRFNTEGMPSGGT